MQAKKKFLGIDGCRFGWCAAVYSDDSVQIELYENLRMLFDKHGDADRVFIDMPMGLSDIRFKRKVDSRLRSLLSPFKHQSVFTPPCREALSATSYREALEVNRKVTGKGISIQSWNIAPKIRELDELLQSSKQLQRIIFESHPEICFFFLHKRNPITSGKKTEEGRKQRLAILCAYHHQIKGVFDKSLRSFQRKEVLPDDMLDALCLGIVAKKSQQDRLILLKDESGTDAFKIPVRVAYFDPTYEKSK